MCLDYVLAIAVFEIAYSENPTVYMQSEWKILGK